MSSVGVPIIGLGERTAEYVHFQLQWMPHIQVADLSCSVAATRAMAISMRFETKASGTGSMPKVSFCRGNLCSRF